MMFGLACSRWIGPIAVLLWAGGWSQGCGPEDNFLEGSISQSIDLGFDFVEVERNAESVVVTYFDQIHYSEIAYQANNMILELSIERPPGIDLLEKWCDVTQFVKLSRYVMIMTEPYTIEQDERTFPEAIKAQIVFVELGKKPGESSAGKFRITFRDGSTLRGGFSAQLM